MAKVLVVDSRPGPRARLSAFLAGLGLETRAAGGLPPGAADALPAADVAAVAFRPGDGALARIVELKTARPALSLVVLADAREAEPLLPHVRSGLIEQVAPLDHLPAIYASVRGELDRRRLAAETAVPREVLRRLRRERREFMRRALEIEEIHEATLENLMTALDLRDVETYGHSRTVAKFSCVLAGRMAISDRRVLDNIRRGALLHDIGKIAIPDAILKKPGPLDAAEWEKVKRHPDLGFGLIKEIKLVPEVGNIILFHHERWDGRGYARGLKGHQIPREARIFALADALDAMTSHRPYRERRGVEAAAREIRRESGAQFDPEVVEAFESVPVQDWDRIRYETTRMLPAIEDIAAPGGKRPLRRS